MGTLTKDPTANSGSFTSGSNAYTDNATYCTVATRNLYHTWSSYAIADPGTTPPINAVYIVVQAYQAVGGDDVLYVSYTTNNAGAYTAAGTVTASTAGEVEYTIDITAAESGGWTWTKLTDANFKTRLSSSRVGSVMATQYIDWMGVKVKYQEYKTGSDTVGATVELISRGKEIYPAADTLGLGDAFGSPSKNTIQIGTVGLSDSKYVNKGLQLIEAFGGLVDDVFRNKPGMIITDSGTITENIFKNAEILLIDVGSVLDSQIMVDTGAIPLNVYVYEVIGLTYQEMG